jgi:hypothetical protein
MAFLGFPVSCKPGFCFGQYAPFRFLSGFLELFVQRGQAVLCFSRFKVPVLPLPFLSFPVSGESAFRFGQYAPFRFSGGFLEFPV